MSHPTSPSRLQVFLSWPFFVSLLTLLLNDYYLKGAYSNWTTGKLSDFSGIFLVSLVLFAVAPSRRRLCGGAVAILFTLWKSPMADPLIDLMRGFGIIGFGRVVDYSDLIALVMIPLAALTVKRQRCPVPLKPRLQTVLAIPAIAVFVFAVTGTSYATFSHKYTIQKSNPNVVTPPEVVLQVINTAAQENGFERIQGNESSLSGAFAHKHYVVEYSIDSDGRTEMTASGRHGEEKKIERFTKTLRDELGRAFFQIDLVEHIE